ncbi:phosphotransferase [Lederbergia citrea]|uniref:Phosphotransferase n=1 Tax=Lederbergia citrea TaxID=2833581 RepID=A0A942UI44_9BACI|nr:phosphotransferase [Lederbergia citrea]MBS4176873.1 phosphotransferase [Lederbergia citrea]MBS4203441.1 phosphotransferase [Lederbergia citrea]MBS4221890.1 phosphotransferase [Lederbergia citrea]
MSESVLDKITTIDAIDCRYLTNLMRKAGFNDATVVAFSRELAGGKSHGGGDIHRFKLTYSDPQLSYAPDSIILKESREVSSQALDPAFARREADCYQNDLFEDIKENLYIPKTYGLMIRPDLGQYWLWMEDLGEKAFDIDWTPEALAKMIRDISELHRTWWGREDELKKMPFLRHRAQAMYDGLWVDRIAKNCQSIEGHPYANQISKVFTAKRREILKKLSRAQDLIYPKLEALPQTLLHHDIWPPNLGRYSGKTVLIDWSYVGQGTPGADLSQTAALLFQMWDPNLDDEALLQALWTGLRVDSGLPVEYERIVAGYELAFCLRPAHALAGPVLGSILSGKSGMVGDSGLEGKLASAEAILQRIEKGIQRLD